MPRRSLPLIACLTSFVLAAPALSQRTTGQSRRLPESVRLEADLAYAGTDNPRQRLDLLLPAATPSEPLPLVVFIHGGAWQGGDKRTGLRRIAPLVASGNYVAASVGYRLSGEATWPAQIHDCKAAIRWLRANAERYHIDPARIGLIGPSAGGHLVAVLGTSSDVDAMNGQLGDHLDQPMEVTCVVDLFGPTDLLKMMEKPGRNPALDHNSPRSPESRLIGGAIQDNQQKAATANPITYVTADDPPFLMVHGTHDPLVPISQSKLLQDALHEVEVPATLITIERGGHGQGFPPEAYAATTRFFDHHLRGEQREWRDETLEATAEGR